MAGIAEYEDLDATGLAALVAAKEASPLELVEEAIRRIERHNPALNAIVHEMFDSARETAKGGETSGPFGGVPFLFKDLGALIKDVPQTMGSRYFRGWAPPISSELTNRYIAAGIIPLGKTNTPELGLAPITEPKALGPCRNPWDPSRTPGGSSGGSGASVAARIVPMAGPASICSCHRSAKKKRRKGRAAL